MADENMNTIHITEKQKVQEITDKLEEGLKELFESEKYKTYKCLSRMRGNSHVRFLGGEAVVIPLTYPTSLLRTSRNSSVRS